MESGIGFNTNSKSKWHQCPFCVSNIIKSGLLANFYNLHIIVAQIELHRDLSHEKQPSILASNLGSVLESYSSNRTFRLRELGTLVQKEEIQKMMASSFNCVHLLELLSMNQ